MQNKELHLIGKNKFEVRTIQKEFNLGINEVLIKVEACGVCGSDLTYAKVSNHSIENSIILGHEFTGHIERIGEGTEKLKVGDRVIVDAAINCGKCEYCLKGYPNLCNDIKFYGYPPYDGGFQERIVFPADFCFKISENMDLASTIIVEPLAVCLHALNLSKFKTGMNAAVIGCGTIGLIMVKLLRHAGANKIFVSEPVECRRKLALMYGADFAINTYKEDFDRMVYKYTMQKGVESVFEASGDKNAICMTTKVAKVGANITMIGIPEGDEFGISHSEARKKALTIRMVRRLNNTIPLALKMLEDGLDLSQIVTHKYSLDNMVTKFNLVQNHKENIIKAVVVNDQAF